MFISDFVNLFSLNRAIRRGGFRYSLKTSMRSVLPILLLLGYGIRNPNIPLVAHRTMTSADFLI